MPAAALPLSTLDSAAPLPEPARHLPGLDGLRGIAILAVLLHHFLPGSYPQGIPGGAHGVLVKTAYRLFDVGWWGVDLFFVLSGFLITGILLDAKGSAHFFRHFYARRSLRIFPLYYGLLFGLFAVLPALSAVPGLREWLRPNATFTLVQADAPKQAWLWLYGTNLKTALDGVGWTFGPLTHLWSLAVEEHFYLVWPLAVFFCSTRTLARVCVAVAIGSVAARVAFLCAGLAPAYIYVLTPCRLDGLALGGLAAILCQRPGGAAALRPAAGRGLRVLAPLAILALLTLPRFGTAMVLAGHLLLAAACAAALPFAALAGRGSAGGWLCQPALRTFGKYSYGIYLLHPLLLEPVNGFVTSAGFRRIVGTSYEAYAVSRAAVGLPCALALAWVSWHLYERHFLRLKAFFPTARPVPAPALHPPASRREPVPARRETRLGAAANP